MSTVAAKSASRVSVAAPGWIRSYRFDMNLIVTVAILAILSGVAAAYEPRCLTWVLLLDLWLLGYHHVVSTFTRLVFDKESFQRYRFLVVELPLIVTAVTIVAVVGLGYWVLPTTYLYWQWFHYTRQSYGIERIYRRKADPNSLISDYAATRAMYLVPLLGIFYRSWQQQETFLGMQVLYLPVSTWVLGAVGGAAAAAAIYWLCTVVHAQRQGRLALAHTLYLVSHHAIFLIGYIAIDDITTGWLVLNVWHNAQYILLVWWFNNNRFKAGIDPRHWFLSTISQKRNLLIYTAVCLGISTIAYLAIHLASMPIQQSTAVPVLIITMMVVNFHHYIVDGIIWRSRNMRKPAPATAET